jgi:ParB family chromosome partitioning protein
MSKSVSPRSPRPTAAAVAETSRRASRASRATSSRSSVADITEVAAVALDGEPRTLPLSSLELSPRNVRKAPAAGIEELAALIRSQGLLQPLCVTPLAEATPPRFAVEAGGRRLRALQWLAARGELPVDAPVECKVFDASRASEVSLAENSARQAMHPADQCEAFRALVDAGRTLDEVALRFGVSAQTVQRRLRLAGLAPELIALYRSGEVSTEQAQALAITEDHERQLAAWHGSDNWSRQPWQLRRRLLGDEVPTTDPRVRFVGLEAYEAAGGAVRRDLFSERDEAFVTDPVLLDRLVAKRLYDEADRVRTEGWSWCEPRLAFDYAERAGFRQIRREPRPMEEAETREAQALRAELDDLRARIDAMHEADEADDGAEDTIVALDDRAEEVEARLRALDERVRDWSDEDRAQAGAIVTIERGELLVLRGLVRRDDAAGECSGDGGSGVASTEAPPQRPEHSERLMLAMTSHLTAAMQASLVASPEVALAVLAHRLLTGLRTPYAGSPVQIEVRASRSTLERHVPDIAESSAGEAMGRERDRWGDALPGEPGALLRWLIAQPQQTLVELLAFCTAEALDATHGAARWRDDVAVAIRDALDLDMADWWSATGQTYLEAVPKARIVAVVTEACGTEAAADLAAMKKADAVRAAEQRLAGTRWLPGPLRRGFAEEEADAA